MNLKKLSKIYNGKEQYNYLKEKENTINKKKTAYLKMSSEIEEISRWINLDISMNAI